MLPRDREPQPAAGGDTGELCRSCCHPALCRHHGRGSSAPSGAPAALGSVQPGAGPASMRPLLGKAGGGGSSPGFSMFLLLELIKVETQAEGADCSWGRGQRRGQPLMLKGHSPGVQGEGNWLGRAGGASSGPEGAQPWAGAGAATTPPQPGVLQSSAAAQSGGLQAGTPAQLTLRGQGNWSCHHQSCQSCLAPLASGHHPSIPSAFVTFSLHHRRPHGLAGAAP